MDLDCAHRKCGLLGISERIFCILQLLAMKNGSFTITQKRRTYGNHVTPIAKPKYFRKKTSVVFSLIWWIISCSNSIERNCEENYSCMIMLVHVLWSRPKSTWKPYIGKPYLIPRFVLVTRPCSDR